MHCDGAGPAMVDRTCSLEPDPAAGVPQTLTCQSVVQGLERFTIEKDVAAYIKKEADAKFGPTWHCIVGRNFGAMSDAACLWRVGQHGHPAPLLVII